MSEAYQILIDPQTRAEYDRFGVLPGSSSSTTFSTAAPPDFTFPDLSASFGHHPHHHAGGGSPFGNDFFFRSPFELFAEFFGSAANGLGGGGGFHDPFFNGPLPRRSSTRSSAAGGSSLFDMMERDPFFSGAGFGGGSSLMSSSSSSPFDDPFFTSPFPSNLTRSATTTATTMSSASSTRDPFQHRHVSRSKSVRTHVSNGVRQTITEIRDGQGNVQIETETQDREGRIQRRVTVNGIEQSSSGLIQDSGGSSSQVHRIHIS